jgi:hypothetical protein
LKVGQTICIESKEMGIGLQSNKKLGSAQIWLCEFRQELKLLCFYKKISFQGWLENRVGIPGPIPNFYAFVHIYLHHHDANQSCSNAIWLLCKKGAGHSILWVGESDESLRSLLCETFKLSSKHGVHSFLTFLRFMAFHLTAK